jgi:hypothetical protein
MSQAEIVKNIFKELQTNHHLTKDLLGDLMDIKVCNENKIQTKYPVLIRDGENEIDLKGHRRYYNSKVYSILYLGDSLLLTNEWKPNNVKSLVNFLTKIYGIPLNVKCTEKSSVKQVVKQKKVKSNWPLWDPPSDDEVKEATKVLVPYLKLLNPNVIRKLEKANREIMNWFEEYLSEFGINPKSYIWEGCVTAFPGIRRANGKTDDQFKRKQLPVELREKKQAIYIDDNSYAKHIWAFLYTNSHFSNNGPSNYELAHIFEHKAVDRLAKEIDYTGEEYNFDVISGFFTMSAGTVYLPRTFVKVSDHNNYVRNLFQRKIIDLYKNDCNILPPGVEIRRIEDAWELDDFSWPQTQHETENIDMFLEFRKNRIRDILDLKIPEK